MLKRLFFRKKSFWFASVAAAVLFLLVNVAVTNAGDSLDLSGGGTTKVTADTPQARQSALESRIVCQPKAGSESGGFSLTANQNTLPLVGSALTDALPADREFTIECWNVLDPTKKFPDTVRATVKSEPPPPAAQLTLQARKTGVPPYKHDPLTVSDGDFVDLTWSYTGADSCAASWKSGTIAAVGSDFSVGPLRNSASPYFYKVTCGALQDSAIVNVNPVVIKPFGCQLDIRPTGGVFGKTATVNLGGNIDLQWKVFGDAKNISIFKMAPNGLSETPVGGNILKGNDPSIMTLSNLTLGKYNYKLNATKADGNETCGQEVNVQVNPASNPDLTPTAPPTVIGPTNPDGAFVSGKEIIISATPKNVGGGDAGKFNVRFQYKLKDQPDESYRVFKKPNGSENFAEVANGLGARLTASAPAEISQTSDKNDANTYEFRYCVDMPPDSPGQVNETQISDSADAQAVPHVGEYNNCSESATVRFAPPPPPPNVGCPPNCVPPPKPPPSSGPLSVTCSVYPNPIDLAKVSSATWTATPSGGTPPYKYLWSAADVGIMGFDGYSSPYSAIDPTISSLTVNYYAGDTHKQTSGSTQRGPRHGKVEVTDSSSRMEDAPQNVTAKCGAPGTTSSPVSVSTDGSLLAACSVSKILTDADGGKYVTWTADTKNSGTSPYSYVWKVGDLPAQTTNKAFVKVNADKDVTPPSFKQGLVVVSDSAQNKILEPKTETADCGVVNVFDSNDDYDLFAGKTATLNFIGETAASKPVPVSVGAGWFNAPILISVSMSPNTVKNAADVSFVFYKRGDTAPLPTTDPTTGAKGALLTSRDYANGFDMIVKANKFMPAGTYPDAITVHSVGGGKSHDATVTLIVNDSRPAFQNF